MKPTTNHGGQTMTTISFRKGDGCYHVYSGTTHLGTVASKTETTSVCAYKTSYSYGTQKFTKWTIEPAPQFEWAFTATQRQWTFGTRKAAAERMLRHINRALAAV